MRHAETLNTIYITNENMYLTLDGENLVCKLDGEVKLRVPFDNIGGDLSA